MEIGLSDGSRFICYQFLINSSYLSNLSYIKLEVVKNKDFQIWETVYVYENLSSIPFSLIDEQDPLVCYKIRLTVDYFIDTDSFPSIGIDFMEAGMMVTEPAITESRVFSDTNIVYNNDQLVHWFPLSNIPTYIIRVFFFQGESLIELNPIGQVSRYKIIDEFSGNVYAFDPLMRTIIIPSDIIVEETTIFVEYITGAGCKATVPIEAIDSGPMFDVDSGTITEIYPEDLEKLPYDENIGWTVYNDNPLQGGYLYWTSEYIDLIAYRYFDQYSIGGFKDGYRGSGTDFRKVGAAPDSFDADVNDYRSFWILPDGESFVKNIWQTTCRGYLTVIGPPNKVIPPGIRFFAPKEISNTDGRGDIEEDGAFYPRIPNGGMLPAQLIIKLNASTNTSFPDDSSFYRKTAAFKPRIMVYMRERVKFNGATLWKAYGDDEDFGSSSEQTGEPYWL